MRYIETRAWLRDGAGKIRWWNERKTKESVGMKIGIINGSIRDERNTVAVADFVFEVASQRNGSVEYELVDLADYDVPLLSSPVHPMVANKTHTDPKVQAWSDKIDALDGYIFVTAEYNHGVPGGFKNAVDLLGTEWVAKPVAFEIGRSTCRERR